MGKTRARKDEGLGRQKGWRGKKGKKKKQNWRGKSVRKTRGGKEEGYTYAVCWAPGRCRPAGCRGGRGRWWGRLQPTQHGLLVTQSTNTAWSFGHSINQHSMVVWSLNQPTQHGRLVTQSTNTVWSLVTHLTHHESLVTQSCNTAWSIGQSFNTAWSLGHSIT